MKDPRFTFKFLLLALAQILLWNYFDFSQYLMIVFLPTLILCMPIKRGGIFAMIIAFATGFAVDFFSSGMLGLTSAALVPVALVRRGIITLVCGEEVFARGENISIRRQGFPKMTLAILMVTALFLFIYIWADGAGTRPFWFNAVKFGASLITGTFISLLVCNILDSESR